MLRVIDIQWYTRRWSQKLQYFWKPTNTENLVSRTNTNKSSYKGNKPRFNSFTYNLLLFPVHSKSSIIDVLMSHSPRDKKINLPDSVQLHLHNPIASFCFHLFKYILQGNEVGFMHPVTVQQLFVKLSNFSKVYITGLFIHFIGWRLLE